MNYYQARQIYGWQMSPREIRLARELGVMKYKEPTRWQRFKAFWFQFLP